MRIKEKVLPLPTDEYISEEEKYWRVKLPLSYRQFLQTYNGGVPVERSFLHKGHAYAIDRFLSILSDYKTNRLGCYDIGVVLTQVEDRLSDNEDLVGAEKLPIAALFAGDLLCLDFKKHPQNPSVCIWFHEESGESDPVTEKVADSFDAFVNMLYEED